MKKFTVNEKEYTAKPFDFNLVCDLEDCGFALEEFGEKRMKAVRAYFAISAGMSVEQAGKEIEQHYVKGGTLADVIGAMSEEMEKSDFFRALFKAAEEKAPENQTEA